MSFHKIIFAKTIFFILPNRKKNSSNFFKQKFLVAFYYENIVFNFSQLKLGWVLFNSWIDDL